MDSINHNLIASIFVFTHFNQKMSKSSLCQYPTISCENVIYNTGILLLILVFYR